VGAPLSGLRNWRPRTPWLPDDLAQLVKPDDPEWFAREMAIAVAPPWWFWRFMLRNFSWLVSIFGRVQVTGELPEELRRGPLLFAANHIGDFDPFVIAVALHTAYPEGRVGLTPDGFPERGRTGMARLALGMGVPVIPVSQWGAHEVLQYGNGWGKLRTLLRAIVRRPALRVHVGPPVALADLRMGRVGDANRARYRIAAALTRGLVPLRADERDRPAFVDPTRPTTAVAAYPSGVVPEDIP
jgi:1-acyl-sn-glycerol-3-phosphate acyltransferase